MLIVDSPLSLIDGITSESTSNDGERYIYVGNGKKVEVEAIENFRLLSTTGFSLDLDETFIVLSFRSNLIFIYALDKSSFFFSFRNEKFSLFNDSKLVGSNSLSTDDNVYLLDTIASFNESLQLSTRGIKKMLINENLVMYDTRDKVISPDKV